MSEMLPPAEANRWELRYGVRGSGTWPFPRFDPWPAAVILACSFGHPRPPSSSREIIVTDGRRPFSVYMAWIALPGARTAWRRFALHPARLLVADGCAVVPDVRDDDDLTYAAPSMRNRYPPCPVVVCGCVVAGFCWLDSMIAAGAPAVPVFGCAWFGWARNASFSPSPRTGRETPCDGRAEILFCPLPLGEISLRRLLCQRGGLHRGRVGGRWTGARWCAAATTPP